ncbi:DUF397 domain-containing protein [Streptomyces sp. NPDC047000]|uniref:DUF397 domain-containing protein n=1 Tax=Streptomyces sp. NPDC047000 TaxID=3155474 RepID=UPI0033EF431D
MNNQQPAKRNWFKSTYSGGDGGECVEVAAGPAAIRVRDSKERGRAQIAFTRGAWSGFVTGLGRDRI